MIENVVIDGMSAISSIGNSLDEMDSRLQRNISGITINKGYPFRQIFEKYKDAIQRPVIGALLPRNNGSKDEWEFRKRVIDSAYSRMLSNAGLQPKDVQGADLLVGSLLGGGDNFGNKYLNVGEKYPVDDMLGDSYSQYIANKHNIKGRVITFSSACASSANALSYGVDLIKNGYSDCVIVAGIDFFSYLTYFGFAGLRSIDDRGAVPFNDDHFGINLGEAVTFMLLKKSDNLNDSRIKIVAKSTRNDGYHSTSPDPKGINEIIGIKSLFEGLNRDLLYLPGYVNAHGTGTPKNDDMEMVAIDKALSTQKYFVSSTKSFHGHTLGAAGLLEAIITARALQKQYVPATIGIKADLENYPSHSKKVKIYWGISNSFAFGGNTVSILFKR